MKINLDKACKMLITLSAVGDMVIVCGDDDDDKYGS